MLKPMTVVIIACSALGACSAHQPATQRSPGDGVQFGGGAAQPLVIGESFTIDSAIMGEVRHINVFVPTVYGEKIDAPMPVLYMLDGGLNEDFLHVAGLVEVLVCNGGMRPHMLVGIQNTSRRRDMTGPTTNEEDRKIAPVVGGSATFRRFIKEELMPLVRSRYRTTEESAIIGESAAGLFIVETLLLDPGMFGTYIAIDPSIWWNSGGLVKSAEAQLSAAGPAALRGKQVFLASSEEIEMARQCTELAEILKGHAGHGITCRYAPHPEEGHATIYHPVALEALRSVLAPIPAR